MSMKPKQFPPWLTYVGGGLLGALITLFFMLKSPDEPFEEQQKALLLQIQQDTARTHPFTGLHQLDNRVLQAMRDTPRHLFVEDAFIGLAYLNRPLPIGHGQTISQPFIVALMTHLAALQPHYKVLEIGTGSGYQAAILAELVEQVYTVEIIPELAEQAQQRLQKLGYNNVQVEYADGSFGWTEAAPYDAIIVTAASETVPQALLEQLASPGKLVIPIGEMDGGQELFVYSKNDEGEVSRRSRLPVSFVPFTGAQADQ